MIVALLTDFGTKDYFVGAMKGVILSINPDAKIIDITHEIEPQNIHSAGFTLVNCYQDFPPKTIFVTVVDPEVGSARKAILVETEDYYFVTPDNGLLSFVLANEKNFRSFELSNPKFFRDKISRTFHGRDVFAPVAAWLSRGIEPKGIGNEVTEIVRFEIAQPCYISSNQIEGEIIHVDNFGNLITNIKNNDLEGEFAIEFNQTKITKHLNHYSQAKNDEIFSVFGSAEYLEIVAYKNSAHKILKAKVGDKIFISRKN